MLKQPWKRYRAFPPIDLPDRRWPSSVIEHPPAWLSTDLRDGNQALFEPMDVARKLQMFQTLVDVGFKEIEVAFPSASQTDFDFVRRLVEEGRIPDDVTIGVLTQAREHLIRRTMESLRGARRAIVHVYNATAPVFRRKVFGLDPAGVRGIAVEAARLIRELAAEQPGTEWVFQYSPEVFSGTELPVALDVCNAVIDIWQPTQQNKVIINLPATVEMATPNVYADQIEWMHRHLERRDAVILSVHPHNDRGTAVAAAELALMAGADRVEGCLFGNGERTGNVDLVTLALNLYSQGVHPGLDFSDIDRVARVVKTCTGLPIHPRHPYVGDLVFTAFSGSHQDAIRKGLAQQGAEQLWEVPYLPIDPADVGRRFDEVIRVNSQSGKGGVAFLLEQEYGVRLPRRLQVEFSAAVQRLAEASGSEVSAAQLWQLFQAEYLEVEGPLLWCEHHFGDAGDSETVALRLHWRGREQLLHGRGNGPVAAVVAALPFEVDLLHFEEQSLEQGADARAMAFVELSLPGVPGSRFGVAVHGNIVTAGVLAVISAANRLLAMSAIDPDYRSGEEPAITEGSL